MNIARICRSEHICIIWTWTSSDLRRLKRLYLMFLWQVEFWLA